MKTSAMRWQRGVIAFLLALSGLLSMLDGAGPGRAQASGEHGAHSAGR